MASQVLSSDDARTRWRDILDAASAGEDVIIARYGKPLAAVIPIADYEALVDEIEEVRSARRAQSALDAWRGDSGRGRLYAEVRAELIAEGLLDAE